MHYLRYFINCDPDTSAHEQQERRRKKSRDRDRASGRSDEFHSTDSRRHKHSRKKISHHKDVHTYFPNVGGATTPNFLAHHVSPHSVLSAPFHVGHRSPMTSPRSHFSNETYPRSKHRVNTASTFFKSK